MFGALVAATVIGALAGSPAAFVIALVLLLAAAYHAGDIRR